MGVVRTVRRVLLKAQAHPVVGIPQALTHTDTMTPAGNADQAGTTRPHHQRGRRGQDLPALSDIRTAAVLPPALR